MLTEEFMQSISTSLFSCVDSLIKLQHKGSRLIKGRIYLIEPHLPTTTVVAFATKDIALRSIHICKNSVFKLFVKLKM